MAEQILTELYETKVEKQFAAEEAARIKEHEQAQRLWEAGELRRTVIEPGIEVAERLEGLLKVIGAEEIDTYVPQHMWGQKSLDEAFEKAREGQYPQEQKAVVDSTSLAVDLGELPPGDEGPERAVARLFTMHYQDYTGTPTKISCRKSKRDFLIAPAGSPTLRQVGLKVSTLDGRQEGDLLDESLWSYRPASSYSDEELAEESSLQELRADKQRIITMGAVVALVHERLEASPANILPPADEFAHMPGSWHLSEC